MPNFAQFFGNFFIEVTKIMQIKYPELLSSGKIKQKLQIFWTKYMF